MKKFILLLLSAFSLSVSAQTWNAKTNSPDCRYDGAAFSTGGKIYYGLGITCAGNQDQSFYVFDPALNTWDTIATFPGATRRMAFAFAVGGKGYVGMGIAQNGNPLNDVWEYNPSTNSWSQKNNFPNAGRGSSFSCATVTKGYVGAGIAYMQFFADYYEYNPVNDTWTGQPSFPGGIRFQGSSFAIGGCCYALLGNDNNATPFNDCWKFDTLLNTWSACATFPGTARAQASAFAVNGNGYAGYGSYADFYEYDPVANSWTITADNNDGNPIYDCAVSTSTAGYCLGEYVVAPDCWEFIPGPAGIPDFSEGAISVSPNPSNGVFTIILKQPVSVSAITITDMLGRIVISLAEVKEEEMLVDLSAQAPGAYLITVSASGGVLRKKLIIQ